MNTEGDTAITLPNNVVLAEGESAVASLGVKASLVQFGTSQFVLTNRRFAGIYFTGLFNSEEFQYPLTNIASAGITKGVAFLTLILGAIIVVVGLGLLISGLSELNVVMLILGVVIGALGVLLALGSFRATVSITNSAGQTLTTNVRLFDRARAEEFFRIVNTQLASL